MTKRAFLFPGQGSQAVGMGRELAASYAEARAVFDEVDQALGQQLSAIMFEGPDDILRLTENAQPALMAVSMAVVRVLASQGVRISDAAAFVAGHSLGEYSALCAAGSFTLADTARLLKTRGEAMQLAVPVGEGAMAAVLGLDIDIVAEVVEAAAAGDVVGIANDNAPGQVVISGGVRAVERAMALAKDKGAKRSLLLPVSAPFHCALMAPAAKVMAEALAEVTMRAPDVPLVCNVIARPITDPDDIRNRLVQQVTGLVRWTESITRMTVGGEVRELVELGAGKVLTGLNRRIVPETAALSLGTPAEIDAFVASFQG